MTGISITPLGETIGARVEGLDLSAELSPEARVAVLEAIGKHKVLVFSGDALEIAAFRAFARVFGPF
jgi:alpha-ketoglutarate-dependent taurine dioxygenase